jgi:hypothetical protein
MEQEQVLESKNRLNFKPYNFEEQDILEGLENLPNSSDNNYDWTRC